MLSPSLDTVSKRDITDETPLSALPGIDDPAILEEYVVKLLSDWPLAYINSNIPDAKMQYWHTTSDPKPKMMTKSHAYGPPGGWLYFPPINLKHSVSHLAFIPSVPYRIHPELVESGPNNNFDASETISECDEVSESLEVTSLSYVTFSPS